MPTLTGLAAADLRQAVLRFRDALRAHQEELNRLNVYPVPDGDTGTNMALTLESVSAELGDRRVHGRGVPRRSAAVRSWAPAATRASSPRRSCAASPTCSATLDERRRATTSSRRCAAAADAAYQAVMRPVEGTILTVVREAAEAVESRERRPTLVGVLERAVERRARGRR